MKYNPDIHHRRSIRLMGYNYSQTGLYFITICTRNQLCLFGNIENDKMILNHAGQMIEIQWQDLRQRFTNIHFDEYIVMPNHFHGIITVGAPLVGALDDDAPKINLQPQSRAPGKLRAPTRGAPTGGVHHTETVGDIVGAFKSISTNEYICGVKQKNWQRFDKKLWQRNYYEHIIRNEKSHRQISEYVKNNPSKWLDDTYYYE